MLCKLNYKFITFYKITTNYFLKIYKLNFHRKHNLVLKTINNYLIKNL